MKKDAPWKRKLKAAQRAYDADPEACIETIRQNEDGYREVIKEGVKLEVIIEAGRSDDPKVNALQTTINHMARVYGTFKPVPKLYILADNLAKEPGDSEWDVYARLPEQIHTNVTTANYFLKHMDHFKAVMAHEMAHIANGDHDNTDKRIAHRLTPPNQMREVLADRMGAIIHGNPRQYAKDLGDFLLHVAECEGTKPHISSQDYSSVNGRLRMLTKWAAILEREHATDDRGNIILDKALDVYKRSEEFAKDLLYTDKHFLEMLHSLPERYRWDDKGR